MCPITVGRVDKEKKKDNQGFHFGELKKGGIKKSDGGVTQGLVERK